MLKPKEIAEIGLLLWHLPLEKVAEIKRLALTLKNECGYSEPTDDSDEWTDEDCEDFARASALYAEHAVPWEPGEEPPPPPTTLPTPPAPATKAVQGGPPQ
jgi:hypothetical protein